MTRKMVTKVLEWKGFTREQIEAEVKRYRELLRQEEEKLASLERQYRTADGELSEKQCGGTMSAHELETFCTYLRHLMRQIGQQREVVAESAANAASREQAMLTAFQEEKLVEKLRDRIAKDEARATDRIEQRQADYGFLSRRSWR